MTEISGSLGPEFFLCTVTGSAFAVPTEFKANIFSQDMDFPKEKELLPVTRTTVFENARFRVYGDDCGQPGRRRKPSGGQLVTRHRDRDSLEGCCRAHFVVPSSAGGVPLRRIIRSAISMRTFRRSSVSFW